MEIFELLSYLKPVYGDILTVIATVTVCLYSMFCYGDDDGTAKLRKITIWAYLIPVAVMVYFLGDITTTEFYMNGAYVSDLYAYAGKIGILIFAVAVILFNNFQEDSSDLSTHLYYPLAMLITLGCFLAISSYNLIYLMTGMAIIGICTSFMVLLFSIGYNSFYRPSGIFIITQLLSFAIFLFGLGYLYSITGNSFYDEIAKWISNNQTSHQALMLALVIIIPTISSVFGAFPFTSLMVRVNSIPDCVIVFLRIVVVIAVMMTLGRFLSVSFGDISYLWKDFVLILGVCGIVVGTIGTLMENEIEKISSYSSISHIGYLFLALGIATENNISAMLIYLFCYVASYIAFVGYSRGIYVNGKYLQNISELRGMSSKMGGYSVVYGLSAVSFAGLPPFTVFIGKMSVMGAVLRWEFSYLLIILIVVGIFQGVWSLRFIREMYQSVDEAGDKKQNVQFISKVEDGVRITRRLAIFVTIFFLFFAIGLMELINKMAGSIS